MTSRLGLFRRCCLHRNSIYFNHQQQFHRFQPRSIHPNSFLYNAYYPRTINRGFATKTNVNINNGIPGKAKPNYILRILFVTSMIGISVAYYYEWTEDIIAFARQRFKYLERLKKDKKDKKTSGSVYKLPKPPKRKQKSTEQTSERPPSKSASKPKPKSIPKPIRKSPVIAKPSPPPPPKPEPKPKPKQEPKHEPKPEPKPEAKQEPKPAPKPEPKPEAKQEAKPEAEAITIPEAAIICKPESISKSELEPIQEAIETLTEETKEISQELIDKYERLKKQVLQMTLSDDDDDDTKDEIKSPPPKLDENETITYIAEIAKLKRMIDQKTLQIEELERDLREKSEFLAENLKALEDGRKSYDEITSIFDEMRTEFEEQMIQQMEYMENERKNRLNKLSSFSINVGVFDKIMTWYDMNNKFFLNLAELNNIIYRFESKIDNGLSYENELKYLLNNLPNNFISHQLLSNLNESQNKNKTFHINSHQQLFDRFCILENALRETAMTPKSTNSLWGNLFAKIFSFLLFSEQISRSGTSLNDRISRAGYSMKLGDLHSALNELNYLDQDILYPAQNWLKSARQRVLGLYAIKMLKTELLSRSIKIIDNEM